MAKFITANALLKALGDRGLIPETTRRVIIDAKVGDAVMVFVEQYGDENLLELITPVVENAVMVKTDSLHGAKMPAEEPEPLMADVSGPGEAPGTCMVPTGYSHPTRNRPIRDSPQA